MQADGCGAGVSAAAVAERILAGGRMEQGEALELLRSAPRGELRGAARRVTAAMASRRFDFCAIASARAGRCGEDCKWCAQSAHWDTGCACHGWIGTEACVEAAKAAERAGAGRIALVTSGRGQSDGEIEEMCGALRAMRSSTRVHLCASPGLLGEGALRKLKEAGLERLHCNIETAPSLFPSMCTTHTQEQKLETIAAARRAGLEICCGGIVGLGETDGQLVEFAFALARVGAESIPVNILCPIPGTPLGGRAPAGPERVLDAVCILRLANPRAALRFAGGRTQLPEAAAREAIRCGINAGIAGPMLTTPGPDCADDRRLAAEEGYGVEQVLREARDGAE